MENLFHFLYNTLFIIVFYYLQLAESNIPILCGGKPISPNISKSYESNYDIVIFTVDTGNFNNNLKRNVSLLSIINSWRLNAFFFIFGGSWTFWFILSNNFVGFFYKLKCLFICGKFTSINNRFILEIDWNFMSWMH